MKWRYWEWLFAGINGKPGIMKFFDIWLIFHFFAAAIFAYYAHLPLKEEASTLTLPLAGVFVGLTFAWAGNAQALMQSDELANMFDKHKDGLENYIYTFQTAVLFLLVTIVGWGVAGLGIFGAIALQLPNYEHYVNFILFLLSSISVRECWHVILGSQFFVLAQRKIRQAHTRTEKSDSVREE